MKLSFFQKSTFSKREIVLSLVFITFIAFWGTALNPLKTIDHAVQKQLFLSRDDTTQFIVDPEKQFSYFSETARKARIAPIVLVTIDDGSLETLGLEWPIPRSVYADIIERIQKYKPRAIGLDLIFAEKSPQPQNDRILAACLKKYRNVILGSLIEMDTSTGAIKIQNPSPAIIPGWSEKEKLDRIGFVDSGIQESSGVIRHARLLIPSGKSPYLSFDALLLVHFLKISPSEIHDRSADGYQQIGVIKVPVKAGAMWINYIKKEENAGSNIYQTCSISTVLKKEDPSSFSRMFKDNIVIVGVTATQAYEQKECPIGNITGPEIHVNILLTVLCQRFLREPAPLARFIYVLLPSLLLALLISYLSPAAGLSLYVILTYILFKYTNYDFLHHGMLHLTALSTMLLFLTYSGMTIANFTKIYRHRKHLKNLLLELAPVPEPVLERIIGSDQGQVRLGGEKVELTILFSDIRGYTSLSQNLDPREVMDTLNEYYSTTGTVHKKNGGMVFDTMGDGQMLVYGAEEASKKNHAFMACKAALEVRDALSTLNDKWTARGRSPVSIGIGINTGPVSLGFLGTRGSGHYKQYAAIGDTTNVASRIESLTKQLQAEIIISETTYEKAKELIEAEPLPPTRVKGKDEPLNIYKVTGIIENKKQG